MQSRAPMGGRRFGNITGVTQMAWKTPTVRKMSVGMEINLYVCATL
jgi:coenzyme PQQ precursor peptide PqqA